MRAIVSVEMVDRYCEPSRITDKLCIPSIVIRYFMVLVSIISVIMMEYTIF